MEKSVKFEKFCLFFLLGILLCSSAGYSESDAKQQIQPEGYPIATDVFTTLQKTVVPGPRPSGAIRLDEVSKYKDYGYGQWMMGGPLFPEKRTDLMGSSYEGPSVTQETRLLNFFTLTDIHVTDKESPNQLIYLQRLHETLPVGASL